MKKGSGMALLPILVFVVFYLGLGIWYEYIMKIPMGFYNIPIVVAFLLSILVASLQNRNTFDDQLDLMANGLRDRNIITICAGRRCCRAECVPGAFGRRFGGDLCYVGHR